jgi:hypothetical protein
MAKSKDYLMAMQDGIASLGEGRRLIDFEMVGASTAYLVIEQAEPGQPPVCTAAVCRFALGQDEQGNSTVAVAEMLVEELNPAWASASGRLLELLSPPLSEKAAAWRQRCRDKLVQHRRYFGPQPGDVITTCRLAVGQAAQAFYILQARGLTTAYGLGLLDGRKYRLRFDEGDLTAVLYGKDGREATLHAHYEYAYQAGSAVGDGTAHQEDLTPWETCLHTIKRRYRPRETRAFALRRACHRFGLNWPLTVMATGTPEIIARQVAAHNEAIPDEQPASIRRQDCWI